jgi:NodT family efflux transporter outer membrane factor (OMF) lipoprotein
MSDWLRRLRHPRVRGPMVCAWALAVSACTVGPDFVRPVPQAPDDWTSWRGGDVSLRAVEGDASVVSPQWWRDSGDPLLDRLQRRAFEASPDLRSAALRYAQSRVQRASVAAQQGPELGVGADIARQRQSERGAGTRMIDVIGGDREDLVQLLSKPFTLYQVGFDASWELDLWGRVRRSIEMADADASRQQALLDLARLSRASEVARNYFELRAVQRRIDLAREDLAALQDRVDLLQARVEGGVDDHLNLERQRAELAAVEAQLPALLAQEGASINQITLLLGEPPGALRDGVSRAPGDATVRLPDLALGVPSEVALRRPDIRAAEARLHRATAAIGVARAELYPSVALGARLGYESYRQGELFDWGSRSWTIGPSLDLPLFDRGRRKRVVQLRELEQQEAAVSYQQTVLAAWHEIDDALSAYAAERQQAERLKLRTRSSADAYALAQARYEGGVTDFLSVLDSQRSYLQARRDLADSEGRLGSRYVTVQKVLGNVPVVPDERAAASR